MLPESGIAVSSAAAGQHLLQLAQESSRIGRMEEAGSS